jgi:diaminopimelate decarboxylase
MIELRAKSVYCQQVKLSDLPPTYDTPLYVYSRQQLEANVQRIASAFASLGAGVRYSVKANSNTALLRLLHDQSCGFDVVSQGELYLTLQIGADPHAIVFAGVGKRDDELRYAVDADVGWINAESREELGALETIAEERGARPHVALRLNPAIDADTHQHIATGGARSKFGIDLDEATQLFEDAQRYPHLDLAGVHVHIGSQLASPDATLSAVQKALAMVDRFGLRMIDIGGGFPVNYQPGRALLPDASSFAQALALHLHGRGLEILIEPGRAIVADAGLLLTRVLSVKQRAGRQIVVVDAGMNDLLRPALYDAYHPIAPIGVGNGDLLPSDIVGPVCESADAFARDRPLPALKRGDLLAITHAGAYGMSMASNYNARPRPAEVLIDGAQHKLIRRRETLEDLHAKERSLAEP